MGATEKRMEQLGIQLQQTDWRGKGAVEAVFAGDILYLSAHFPVDEMGRCSDYRQISGSHKRKL